MEIRTTKEILTNGFIIKPLMNKEQYMKVKWVSLEYVLKILSEYDIDGIERIKERFKKTHTD